MPDFFHAPVILPLWLAALVFVGWSLTLVVVWQHFRVRQQPWAHWRRGDIFGIRWQWGWQGRTPVRITPFCTADDTELVYHYRPEMRDVLYCCESCGGEYGPFAGDHSYVLGMIRRQIERRCTDGSWDQAPTAAPRPGAADGVVGVGPALVANRHDNDDIDDLSISTGINPQPSDETLKGDDDSRISVRPD